MTHAELGADAHIDDGATVGYEYGDDVGPTVIGDDATVRAGTRIYADVTVGDGFVTGHDALVREHTTIGDDVVLGTKSVLDGSVTVGSNVSIQTGVYVPPETEIGDRVFLGPNAVMTNDPYPLRVDVGLEGPTIEDDVSVGANATILPNVTVGEGAFVAAGAVVIEDVPPETLAVGVPAEHRSLPDSLPPENLIA
jgi:acetyltransferase-like isoleucine patch superfamily enzyme